MQAVTKSSFVSHELTEQIGEQKTNMITKYNFEKAGYSGNPLLWDQCVYGKNTVMWESLWKN